MVHALVYLDSNKHITKIRAIFANFSMFLLVVGGGFSEKLVKKYIIPRIKVGINFRGFLLENAALCLYDPRLQIFLGLLIHKEILYKF